MSISAFASQWIKDSEGIYINTSQVTALKVWRCGPQMQYFGVIATVPNSGSYDDEHYIFVSENLYSCHQFIKTFQNETRS